MNDTIHMLIALIIGFVIGYVISVYDYKNKK